MREKKQPKQPWMSERSWNVVRSFASIRQKVFHHRAWEKAFHAFFDLEELPVESHLDECASDLTSKQSSGAGHKVCRTTKMLSGLKVIGASFEKVRDILEK